jgi:hypothetical protein
MTKRISSLPSARPAERHRARESRRAQQFDLFGGALSPTAPTWQELPEETKIELTNLLARMILEHAQASTFVPRTEVRDDQR